MKIRDFVDGTRRATASFLRETLSNTWNCSNKLQLYVVNITISNIMLLLTEHTRVCRAPFSFQRVTQNIYRLGKRNKRRGRKRARCGRCPPMQCRDVPRFVRHRFFRRHPLLKLTSRRARMKSLSSFWRHVSFPGFRKRRRAKVLRFPARFAGTIAETNGYIRYPRCEYFISI